MRLSFTKFYSTRLATRKVAFPKPKSNIVRTLICVYEAELLEEAAKCCNRFTVLSQFFPSLGFYSSLLYMIHQSTIQAISGHPRSRCYICAVPNMARRYILGIEKTETKLVNQSLIERQSPMKLSPERDPVLKEAIPRNFSYLLSQLLQMLLSLLDSLHFALELRSAVFLFGVGSQKYHKALSRCLH